MRVRTFVFFPLLTVLLALAGLWLASETNSDSNARAQEIGAAGDPEDPCERLTRLERVRAVFVVKSGEDHEEFIDLEEEIDDLRIECDELNDDGAGAVPQGIGAAGLIANVNVSADPSTNFVAVNGTYDPDTNTITATGMGTVAGFPNVSIELEMTIGDDGEVTGTYTMGGNGELPGGFPAVYEITGEGTDSTPTPTPVVTETPPPTDTPTPTATGRTGQNLTMGNLDCDEDGISTRDNQALLRNVLSQAALSQTEPCPNIGDVSSVTVPSTLGQQLAWGDMDCDGEISTRDNQALLRNVLSQAALSQTEPCPDIGVEILVFAPG